LLLIVAETIGNKNRAPGRVRGVWGMDYRRINRFHLAVSASGMRRSVLGVLLAAGFAAIASGSAMAQTWNGASTAWGDPNNWTPTTVPSSTGTGTFTNTGSAAVNDSLGAFSVGTISFSSNAQAYTFDIENGLIVNGPGIGSGIINNSTNTQVFNIGIIFGNLPPVVFNGSSSASGGTGAVTINNSGFITFQNTSTAGNATIVNNEILTFTDNSSAGTSHITNNIETDFFFNATASGSNITNNNTLTFNNNATAATSTITNNFGAAITFANTASGGTANITNNNAGTITFANTASGGGAAFTNNAGAQITFNDSSSAGTTATYGNSGAITFNNTATGGGAAFTNNGGGQIVFNNNSSAGTTASYTNNLNGSITFNNNATGGSASFTNSIGGNIVFNDTSTGGNGTFNNSGGQIVFINSSTAGTTASYTNTGGNIVFDNTSSAGGATFTNDGVINFNDSSSAGSAIIVNNGVLGFNGTSSAGNATITTITPVFFVQTSTGGNAQLIANIGGIFDFSQSTGPNGDGHVSAGSIAGAGRYNLGADQLTVGSNNLSTVVSGVIADGGGGGGTGGSLVKVGTGTLTLSGINTYTGATSVNGGTLEVDGSIAKTSGVTVNSGGTLSGTGIVDPAATTIMSGGTLAPGSVANPTGALTIAGNLAFQSGAIYQAHVTPTTAATTNVSGTATLGGATVNAVFANGSYISKTYTILSAAGGVSGTFGALTNTNLPSNFIDTLGYDANNAYLNLKLGFVVPGGLNVNQQNVANALSNFFNTTGGIPMVYGTLTPAGLTQASGELATGAQQTTFDAMNLFLGLLTDPFMNRGGGANTAPGATGYADEALGYAANRRSDAFAMFTKAPPAPFEQRWSVWSAGYGGSQSTDGNAALGSNNTTSSVFGTAVGADYLFSPNTIAGFALAGGGTNFSVNGSGSGHSDLFQAGAYVRHTQGAAYVSAALAYGWQDITTNRTVTVAGVDQLRAEFNANAYSGRLEGGYRFATPWMGVTPYGAAQFTTFDLPSYAESVLSGSSAFALAYGAKDVTDARSELGIRTDRSFLVQDGLLTLRGRLAWAHDYDPNRSIGATFQALPGASFVVNGAAQASDSALTTASIEMKWRNGWSAAATFEGEFSDVTSSYAGKGVVRYTW
jgi:uncharacterized protein with beta-barrel porin domain